MNLYDLAPPTVASDPQQDRRRFRRAAWISLAFLVLLWWIKLAELAFATPLSGLGVRPLEPLGLLGVLTAPMLHGSVPHLLANTLPLLVLGTLLLAAYPRASLRVIALVWLLSGLGVWLIGRPSIHLGASGLSHGLMLFLFVAGLMRRDRRAVAVALIAFFLYGGMLLSVLPGDPAISWEAHLTGAAAGAFAALLWRRRDPLPERRRYSWEFEDEADDELQDPLAARDREQFEPPRPQNVPVLWRREPADAHPEADDKVVPMPSRRLH